LEYSGLIPLFHATGSPQNKVAPAKNHRSGSKNSETALTNTGAQEASIVVETHLPTGENVCYSGDRFSVATRARTDRQDQITQ